MSRRKESLIDRTAKSLPSQDACRDLFGEIPVSERDLRLWLWSVPVWFNRHSRQSAIDAYLRGYNVAGKVARAKAENRLGEIFGDETCPHCGAPLEIDLQARIDDLEAENAELRALLERPRAPAVPLRPVPRKAESRDNARLPLVACHR